jgi:hypothetical protein
MGNYGQLIHVEEYCIGEVSYRIAVSNVEGGLNGSWTCRDCECGDKNGVHPTIEECVTATRRLITDHHLEIHLRGRPEMDGTFFGI